MYLIKYKAVTKNPIKGEKDIIIVKGEIKSKSKRPKICKPKIFTDMQIKESEFEGRLFMQALRIHKIAYGRI